jgi:hypothetical protein
MEGSRLEETITPFYLRMMGLNGISAPPELLNEVVEAGRSLSALDVVELLEDSWRPVVMGAWFSLLQEDLGVNVTLLESLASSLGSLTSPSLTVAAIVLVGTEAVPTLEEYLRQDLEFEYGACGFTSAALEHLGVESRSYIAEDQDRNDFFQLMERAKWIRLQRPL